MEETVTLYDFDSKTSTEIPAAELAPGMIQVQIEGRDGVVWVDASQLEQNSYQHPPFEGERREAVAKVQSSFPGVYDKSYEFWEDGFRKDANPDSEISLWLHMAEVYLDHAADLPKVSHRELFSLVVACSNSPRDQVRHVFDRATLPETTVESAIAQYYAPFTQAPVSPETASPKSDKPKWWQFWKRPPSGE